MKEQENLEKLKEQCFLVKVFDDEILEKINDCNYWNIWVPKVYGGLELSLSKGLKLLKNLAKIDGSLGWTVTLCSGANYFIGNLTDDAARHLFKGSKKTCLGGSGSVGGKAVKDGDTYTISGKWPYATGAHYLTHYTLNAEVYENGKALKNNDGSTVLRSFIIPASKVRRIDDWTAMGLEASVTCSFKIDKQKVDQKFSFAYDKTYLSQDIYKIPFRVFADLTLWVNYIGMAEHFYKEAGKPKKLSDLRKTLKDTNEKLHNLLAQCEEKTAKSVAFETKFCDNLHESAAQTITQLSHAIIAAYPTLGIRACSIDQQLNQIFRDYFTATQHHNFTK